MKKRDKRYISQEAHSNGGDAEKAELMDERKVTVVVLFLL